LEARPPYGGADVTPADLIVENARVRTLDPESPAASAVALLDGLIVAVGDRTETASWRGARTDVVDLAGATLLPGLVDSHLHPFLGTDQARCADLTGLRRLDEVLEACDRAFRTRDLLDSGAVLTLGSDWPVARFDPRRGMGWARLRREPGACDALPNGGDQALTPLEALAGYTTAPALTVGEQRLSGRIAPGFRADLTAMAADPVDTPADDLLDLPVVLTVVDGQIVHRADC
jgi:predicted amidohydrolase YtcJ